MPETIDPDIPVTKDPSANLDYSFDWAPWIDDIADSIATFVVTASGPAGLVVGGVAVNGAVVSAWVSGGSAGKRGMLTCRITTTLGRTDERSIYFVVRER